MSALSNIPPQAVLPLSAYDLADLRRAAASSNQTFLHADCTAARDKPAVMQALMDAFPLPSWFGRNLDALYDCVTDLEPDARADKPGFVIVLENLPDTEEFDRESRNRLLDVFRDAADYFDDAATAFRVFYSVNKAGADKAP